MTDIEELLGRVKAATGPDREIDFAIERFTLRHLPSVLDYWTSTQKHELVSRYTASVDACIALVEHELPGWQYHMGTCGEDDMPWACITEPEEPCRDFTGSASSISLAMIEALLGTHAARIGE